MFGMVMTAPYQPAARVFLSLCDHMILTVVLPQVPQAIHNVYIVQLDSSQVIILFIIKTIASVHCIGVLGPKTPSDVVDKVCAKFSFMGKYVARSLMNSKMVS